MKNMQRIKVLYMLLFVSITAIAFMSYDNMYNNIHSVKHISLKKKGKITKQHSEEAEPPPMSKENNISAEAFIKARKQARAMKAKAKAKINIPKWEFRGPSTYGRITAIVADPENPDKVYVGTAQGGVWKSMDGGEHYKPIFDHSGGSLSIGALALDPHDSNIIYVGTGECDGPNQYNRGDGLWRSTDGGEKWTHIDLKNALRIGSIVINPNNNEIFVAVYKSLNSNDEGIYKSTDGGKSWTNVLKPLDGKTHARTIHMDPKNPKRLYVEMWSNTVGPGGGIWKSEDSGEHWIKLQGGLPKEGNQVIFSLAPSNPDRLYAAYPNENAMSYDEYPNGTRGYDLYRSDNYGEKWDIVPIESVHDHVEDNRNALNIAHKTYCAKLKVAPDDKNKVYLFSADLYISEDGGKNFSGRKSQHLLHVDHHAMWFSPNGETIYEGNDGGVYKSTDSENNYTFQSLPIGQFYAIEVDPIDHNKILGGLQDNGSGYTTDGKDWHKINYGDGFTVLVDGSNTSYVYSEAQNGTYIKLHKNDTELTKYDIPNEGPWHTRMVLDPSNNKVVYYGGSNYLYTTTRTGDNLSPLTKVSEKEFGSINAINVPISSKGETIYVSSNTTLYVSRNKGETWEEIPIGNEIYEKITRISTDPKNDAIVYIAINSKILRSTEYGKNPIDISNNLPHIRNEDILVDPDYSTTLYCASQFGVYISVDTGKTWAFLGQDLPETQITDLKIIKEDSEIILYAGTYGRGIYSIRLTDAQRKGIGLPHVPKAPTNLQENNVTSNSATLTWKYNSNIEDGFKIYYGYTLVKTVGKNVKTITLAGLKANTEYEYSVKAYNDAGESNAVSTKFTTLPPTPDIPTIPLNTTVNNTWDANTTSTHRAGRYAKFYTFTLTQSTEVTIDLTSSKDTYMILLSGKSTNGTKLAYNDDYYGLNSHIEKTLQAGSYTIEATTYRAKQTGRFTVGLKQKQ